MSQIEAVFFDCDGTLVDSEVICSRAYVTMFQEFGESFSAIRTERESPEYVPE